MRPSPAAVPTQSLISIDFGIWIVDHPMVLSGIKFPTRMTLIEREPGCLLAHSPVPLSEDVLTQIRTLGVIDTIIAPNRFHHFYVGDLQQAFPEAQTYLAPGLKDKRPKLSFDGELSEEHDARWQPGLQRIFIDGTPSMSESVFFHQSSGSLILTDLVFNMTHPQGLPAHIFLRLTGTHGRMAQSLVWRLLLTKDRAAAKASCERILQWPIRRVIPCHGEVFNADSHSKSEAIQTLGRALKWMLT